LAYEYQPKFPRQKLREVVMKYLEAMRSIRYEPNCGVAFSADGQAVADPRVRGWLLKDTRPGGAGSRYVLLEDGDVWREVEQPQAAPGAGPGERVWLEGPDDDLVTLLARSQANARLGLDAYLEREEEVELLIKVVADRRAEQKPFDGPERRSKG
jgi:hypothetical protein